MEVFAVVGIFALESGGAVFLAVDDFEERFFEGAAGELDRSDLGDRAVFGAEFKTVARAFDSNSATCRA